MIRASIVNIVLSIKLATFSCFFFNFLPDLTISLKTCAQNRQNTDTIAAGCEPRRGP